MKRYLILIVMLVISSLSYAQKVHTVNGHFTYYAPENVSLEEAKRTALERAKLQALAERFGTTVSQYNTMRTENSNGQSSSDFSSIGGTEVKGEWLETLGEPEYAITYEGNMLVVDCKVKGHAREIVNSKIDYAAKILRNGTEDKFESKEFRSGDDLFLSFQSPVNGYLAVYLVDNNRQAFCLLPYLEQNGIYPIEANRRYVFFNEKEAPAKERSYVNEYTMTCERPTEFNDIYIIFSPNKFTKATDAHENEKLPRQLSFEEFYRWYVKHLKSDKDMSQQIIPITITKK